MVPSSIATEMGRTGREEVVITEAKKQSNKLWRLKNQEKLAGYARKHRKSSLQYQKTSQQWRLKNKEKLALRQQEYRLKNKEKLKNQLKTFPSRIKEHRAKISKTYYDKNREKILINRRRVGSLYYLKIKNTLNFRILRSLRMRLRNAIIKGHKSANTLVLLGCTAEEFKKHIESLWQEGMSWDNYGYYGWHIDHKRPCSSFNLVDPEQQKICFHWTNMQPLWAKENLKKGDQWD